MLGFDALAKLPLGVLTTGRAAGALNATQDNHTLSSSGALQIKGAASLAQDGQTLSASGAVQIQGNAALTQAGQALSSSGVVQIKGSTTASQADQTLSASGTGQTVTYGELIKSQDSQTVSAAGAVLARGSAAGVQADQALSSSGAVQIKGATAATQAGQTLAAAGKGGNDGDLNRTQDSQTVSAAGIIPARGAFAAVQPDNALASTGQVVIKGAAAATQAGDTVSAPEPFVVAPSYGHWVKKQNKNKPQAPKLPDPVQAGQVVIDEAVLRQMEEERLAALVLKAKQDALQRVEDLRAYAPEPAPRRTVTIDPRRFDVVETAPEIRTRVVTLFRPAPKPELKEPVRGSITLRALGPRHLPEPDIRKARTISLRRAPSRSLKTG